MTRHHKLPLEGITEKWTCTHRGLDAVYRPSPTHPGCMPIEEPCSSVEMLKQEFISGGTISPADNDGCGTRHMLPHAQTCLMHRSVQCLSWPETAATAQDSNMTPLIRSKQTAPW